MTDDKQEQMVRALVALRLEVAPSIASDVQEKVLAAYNEQGAQIAALTAKVQRLEDRLEVSPFGDDKIDELEMGLEIARLQVKAQQTDVEMLREAINALPFVPHTNGCLAFDTVPCCCGAATHNAALERVRRAAGLED